MKDDSDGGSSNSANFDTLREAAEETSVEDDEEKEKDDTDIEVLEEGLKSSGQTQKQKKRQQSSNSSGQNGQVSAQSTASDQGSPAAGGDLSSVEDKLDRIIEQNEKMIEILESFGS